MPLPFKACVLKAGNASWSSVSLPRVKRALIILLCLSISNSKVKSHAQTLTYVSLTILLAALRIILAESPRQVVNAVTLYSLLEADLLPTGSNAATDGRSNFEQFWVNLETLAESNREQAVVLFTMLFTLIIWVVSALSLIAAVVLYIVFLWHYVPQEDGRLSIYCRRKIDRRLAKIVGEKVKQALEDQEKQRLREEARSAKKNEGSARLPRHPTLPKLNEVSSAHMDNKHPPVALTRENTQATISSETSRPSHDLRRQDTQASFSQAPQRPLRSAEPMLRQPKFPRVRPAERRPAMPYRSATGASAQSNTSYASNAPLLNNATDMGFEEDMHGYQQHDLEPLEPSNLTNHPMNQNNDYQGEMRRFPSYTRPRLDRDMAPSYQTQRPPPSRSTTPYAGHDQPVPVEGDDGQNSRPYPGPPVDQDLSLQHQHSLTRPPPMRSMTPRADTGQPARLRTGPSVPQRPPYGLDEYCASPAPVVETPISPEEHQISVGLPLQRQLTHGSVAPFEDNTLPLPRQAVQPFHRPFSPPVRAATTLGIGDQHDPQAFPVGQSFEMTTRPSTANIPTTNLQPPPPNGGYIAFNPIYARNPSPAPPAIAQRSVTTPWTTLGAPSALPRSATAPPQVAYEDFLNDYHAQAGPSARS